jgi:hypothetical protein
LAPSSTGSRQQVVGECLTVGHDHLLAVAVDPGHLAARQQFDALAFVQGPGAEMEFFRTDLLGDVLLRERWPVIRQVWLFSDQQYAAVIIQITKFEGEGNTRLSRTDDYYFIDHFTALFEVLCRSLFAPKRTATSLNCPVPESFSRLFVADSKPIGAHWAIASNFGKKPGVDLAVN